MLMMIAAIDYILALLTDREALLARLQTARNTLARGHPALAVSDAHVDENKVPLWEREWKGGTGQDDEGMDDEGGASDEEG